MEEQDERVAEAGRERRDAVAEPTPVRRRGSEAPRHGAASAAVGGHELAARVALAQRDVCLLYTSPSPRD